MVDEQGREYTLKTTELFGREVQIKVFTPRVKKIKTDYRIQGQYTRSWLKSSQRSLFYKR